jgi:hypothetical protein
VSNIDVRSDCRTPDPVPEGTEARLELLEAKISLVTDMIQTLNTLVLDLNDRAAILPRLAASASARTRPARRRPEGLRIIRGGAE